MARHNVPFEIGSRVKVRHRYTRDDDVDYPEPPVTVMGYTYWGAGLSVLTIDDDGNEREHIHGCGLKAV